MTEPAFCDKCSTQLSEGQGLLFCSVCAENRRGPPRSSQLRALQTEVADTPAGSDTDKDKLKTSSDPAASVRQSSVDFIMSDKNGNTSSETKAPGSSTKLRSLVNELNSDDNVSVGQIHCDSEKTGGRAVLGEVCSESVGVRAGHRGDINEYDEDDDGDGDDEDEENDDDDSGAAEDDEDDENAADDNNGYFDGSDDEGNEVAEDAVDYDNITGNKTWKASCHVRCSHGSHDVYRDDADRPFTAIKSKGSGDIEISSESILDSEKPNTHTLKLHSAGERCDCHSVLTHLLKQKQPTSAVVRPEAKPSMICHRLLMLLFLVLLIVLLLMLVCYLQPLWYQPVRSFGMAFDWQLRHVGGSPPI